MRNSLVVEAPILFVVFRVKAQLFPFSLNLNFLGQLNIDRKQDRRQEQRHEAKGHRSDYNLPDVNKAGIQYILIYSSIFTATSVSQMHPLTCLTSSHTRESSQI